MGALCGEVECREQAPCGGAMLRCLTEKAEFIVVPECQHVRSLALVSDEPESFIREAVMPTALHL